ncbi:uncharacterized protein LOC113926439 isoform X2 [Zalophus californianus]|uniref:Uncharacterized protein LOC113926439 isoform X2 n=1 Tax=Zalophus californianus TaxID=9704 RepID=A0A6J2DN43_ZALCA|nr:uncharacterized protein LOC113926439 isoform X2 [Zalophus californianus]
MLALALLSTHYAYLPERVFPSAFPSALTPGPRKGGKSKTPPLRGLSSPASTSQKRHPGVPVTPTCPLTAQSGCRQSLPEPHTQNPRSQLWSLKPKLSLLPISHLVCLQDLPGVLPKEVMPEKTA